MATLSANFLSKTAIGLRYTIPLIPRVKRSGGIACSCSKGRDYSTSFPVRYIPKKLSKSGESVGSSLTTKHFEDVEKHKTLEQNVERTEFHRDGKGPSRNFLFDDQEPVGSVNLSVELGGKEIGSDIWAEDEYMEEPKELEQEVECNLEKYSEEGGQIKAGRNKEDAEKLVIQLLSTRAFTALGLRKKLQGKRLPLNIVDGVIRDFENRGFINDRLYAEAFSRSRWSSSCWGPKRIKQALHEKGISKVDAEKALNVVFKDGENGEDLEAGLGMSKLSIDHLLIQASKQWLRSHGVDREKRKSRLVRWLQYRGFNWSVINFVLKKLESEYPPLNTFLEIFISDLHDTDGCQKLKGLICYCCCVFLVYVITI